MGLRNEVGALAIVSIASFACASEASDERTAPVDDSAATSHAGGEAQDSASGGANWLTGSIGAGASALGGARPDIGSSLPGGSGAAQGSATEGAEPCPHQVPTACRAAGNSDVFQPLGLLPDAQNSDAMAVSADGTTVVGYSEVAIRHSQSTSYVPHAARWTAASGLVSLHPEEVAAGVQSAAFGVSADGRVVAGYVGQRPVRWVDGELEYLEGIVQGTANAVSADGSAVVGMGSTGDYVPRAFRWTREQGVEWLEPPTPSWFANARAISADGRVIVGDMFSHTLGVARAFRWSEGEGLKELTTPDWCDPGTGNSGAYDLNEDGSVIVGMASSGVREEPVRWQDETVSSLALSAGATSAIAISADAGRILGQGETAVLWTVEGASSLGSILSALGVELDGWRLTASAVSDDGRVVVGLGRCEPASAAGTDAGSSCATYQGFVARLP
jgi:uncharacterized membrane protein